MQIISHYCKRYYRFWSWVLRQFVQNQCLVRASSLTYTSLLALVPLMIVIVSALSLFPFFNQASHGVQHFIFDNFVPHTGSQVLDALTKIEKQAGKLPAIGFGFLFLTAIMLMTNIDRVLNDIIYSPEKRRIQNSLLMYWALLTIGPLLLGASLAMSSYLQSLSVLKGYGVSELVELLMPLPFLLSIGGFSFIYTVVPHGQINIRHGLLGGFFAALMFELAKLGFGYYVKAFPTYEVLYGALATIPLFLLWVYVSWMIFLLGAQVVNGLRYQQAWRSQHTMPNLLIAYTVLFAIWRAQESKRVMSFKELLAKALPKCDIHQLQMVLLKLCRKGLIVRNKGESYTLLCDCHNLTVYQLQRMLGWTMSDIEIVTIDTHPVNQQLKQLLLTQQEWIDEQKPESLHHYFVSVSKSTV